MKTLIYLLITIFSLNAFAQFPDNTPGTKETREKAKKITTEYDKHLGLDGDQWPLFLDKVEDYLIYAEKAKADYEGKEELNVLLALQIRETNEMDDILTQHQHRLYKKIKPEIQPLKVITE